MNADDPRHGTTRGYHAGCRDECCRAAIRRYEKGSKYRQHAGITWAIPAIGTQRRIQALMRLGWTSSDIAAEAGYAHRNHVFRILKGQKGIPTRYVERKTYRAIAEAYERLSMRLPEPHHWRTRTRNLAERNGWLPPLAWDDIDDPAEQPILREKATADIDEVLIQRVLSGDACGVAARATTAERIEIRRRWVAAGRSINELARLTGWKPERYAREDVA